MKWKNNIYVFDDILTQEQQEQIKTYLLGPSFPWTFQPDITGGDRIERPGMSHRWIAKGEKISSADLTPVNLVIQASLQKLYEKTKEKANYHLDNSRSFLQFPLKNLDNQEYDAHHIDHLKPHLSILYYVLDADGDTVLFDSLYSASNPLPPEPKALREYKRVSPKQGRVVIFDGYRWHTATQPQKGIRCVINSNILIS